MFGQFCSFLECKLIGWYGGGWKADARFLPTLYVACKYIPLNGLLTWVSSWSLENEKILYPL